LSEYSLDEVIDAVANLENSERLTADLNAFKSADQLDQQTIDKQLAQDVQVALSDEPDRRRARLASKTEMLPRKVAVTSTSFVRDPDVIAEALYRAKGQCDECNKEAPFFRKSDGRPYLEVHHKLPLANGCKVTFVLIKLVLIRYPSFVLENSSVWDAIDVIRVVARHIWL